MNQPLISVICPIRNEANYIATVLAFAVKALPDYKEIIIVDGCSTDSSREIVNQYTKKYSFVTLLDNPDKYVPFALNKAIKFAKGNYIIRLDAHTEYAEDYFIKIIDTFEKTGAEIVGGPMRAIGKTSFQKAVAVCTSTKFGVGDSHFHDENFSGYTDSVYLGAWKHEIFEKIGMFDEQMLRNQDDEFHYRAKSNGMKIYLNPEIRSWYYPRNNFLTLWKQYFQYGLFKPLVLKKVKSEIKFRHLIPSVFVLYIISALVLIPFLIWFVLIPLALYLVLDIYFSLRLQHTFVEKGLATLIYPVLHLSYGLGFLLGLFKKNFNP